MGVPGLWKLVQHEGYDPPAFALPLEHSGKLLVDVLGAFYGTILLTYTKHAQQTAETIIVERFRKLFPPSSSVQLYIDGGPAQEKAATHAKRSEKRHTALKDAKASIGRFRKRTDDGLPVRKQHHLDIKNNLKTAFAWPMEVRRSLAAALRQAGYEVKLCELEADVDIAKDCSKADVVVTRDSDALIYQNISTIWRFTSGRKVLVYEMEKVLQALGLTREQFTVLGIVSLNDYSSNIPRMGCSTNMDVVKNLKGTDVQGLVTEYLCTPQVVIKNKTNNAFESPLQVFVQMLQTPALSTSPPENAPDTDYTTLSHEYGELCDRQQIMFKEQRQQRQAAGKNRAEPSGLQGTHKLHNKYRSVVGPPGFHQGSRVPEPRPRYSARHRTLRKKQPEPQAMTRYTWKNHQPRQRPEEEQSEAQRSTSPSKKKKTSKKEPTSISDMSKQELRRAMAREHPVVTLTVGTLGANVERAADGDKAVADEVRRTVQECSRLAGDTKRRASILIGIFVQEIQKMQGPLSKEDRELLDTICPPIPKPGVGYVDADEDVSSDNQVKFMFLFLRHLYSGESLPHTKNGELVRRLLDRCPAARPPDPKAYSGMSLLESTATELAKDIRQHYRQGSIDIAEKLKKRVEKGLLPEKDVEIHYAEPAILNFLRLNKLHNNRYKLSLIPTVAQPFVYFSERDLLPLLWKSEVLRNRIKNLSGRPNWSLADMQGWLMDQEPGYLISRLITTVGRGRIGKGRSEVNPTHYQRSTSTWALDSVRAHLQDLSRPNFDPTMYSGRGYVLQGGIATNGHRLHLTAYKVKELQGVRFRRMDVPSRLTTSVRGTDYFLTEVRNVIKTVDDVSRLWSCPASEIKYLGLDLGQAFTVAACAIVPNVKASTKLSVTAGPATSVSGSTGSVSSATTATSDPVNGASPIDCRNLAVNQKALYQPTLKFRRWCNEQKAAAEGSGKSIKEIEQDMPEIRGFSADIKKYAEYTDDHLEHLQKFYGKSFQKHKWDSRRAKEAEYAAAADQLLHMIGGTIGEHRKEDNYVLIGIGLGDFQSQGRLTSLHGSFCAYFVSLARALGYILVGVNEFYTSKKCPNCRNFVCQVKIRILYCTTCQTYFHRDVLAGNNIANILQGHVQRQERPHYLQPVDEQGRLIWSQPANIASISTASAPPTPSGSGVHPSTISQGLASTAGAAGPGGQGTSTASTSTSVGDSIIKTRKRGISA